MLVHKWWRYQGQLKECTISPLGLILSVCECVMCWTGLILEAVDGFSEQILHGGVSGNNSDQSLSVLRAPAFGCYWSGRHWGQMELRPYSNPAPNMKESTYHHNHCYPMSRFQPQSSSQVWKRLMNLKEKQEIHLDQLPRSKRTLLRRKILTGELKICVT